MIIIMKNMLKLKLLMQINKKIQIFNRELEQLKINIKKNNYLKKKYIYYYIYNNFINVFKKK